jgi:hypothetical protein
MTDTGRGFWRAGRATLRAGRATVSTSVNQLHFGLNLINSLLLRLLALSRPPGSRVTGTGSHRVARARPWQSSRRLSDSESDFKLGAGGASLINLNTWHSESVFRRAEPRPDRPGGHDSRAEARTRPPSEESRPTVTLAGGLRPLMPLAGPGSGPFTVTGTDRDGWLIGGRRAGHPARPPGPAGRAVTATRNLSGSESESAACP